MTPLKLIFMGTPDFAAVALQALVDAGHQIVAVYSQPPRPAGRGNALRKSAVQLLAEERGLQVRTPERLKSPEAQSEFAAFGADAAVVAAYGLILPQAILDAPRLGCLNIHASLLPRWRGAAPIQRAILAGDTETGISIMQMDAGLDTGAVLLQVKLSIDRLSAGALHDRLAALGGEAIVATLSGVASGRLLPVPQPTEGATYAAKITPDEARLDWRKPADAVEDAVRAFSPKPGAWILLPDGDRLKILSGYAARPPGGGSLDLSYSGAPGTILDNRMTVACGIGALHPQWVQRAGKRPLEVEIFMRGSGLAPGTVLP